MNYVHTGKIQGAFKRGGHWKIPRTSLERFKTQGNPEGERVDVQGKGGLSALRRVGQYNNVNLSQESKL